MDSLIDAVADPAELINLNIGGSSYKLRACTLQTREPSSRLARLAVCSPVDRLPLCDAFLHPANEYFFERPAQLFDAIFKFYTTGQLHRPLHVCELEFRNELHYWQIPEKRLEPCCIPPLLHKPLAEEFSIDDLRRTKKGDREETTKERIYRFCEGDGSIGSALFTGIR